MSRTVKIDLEGLTKEDIDLLDRELCNLQMSVSHWKDTACIQRKKSQKPKWKPGNGHHDHVHL